MWHLKIGNGKFAEIIFLKKWTVLIIHEFNMIFPRNTEETPIPLNYATILPDSTGILGAHRQYAGHLSQYAGHLSRGILAAGCLFCPSLCWIGTTILENEMSRQKCCINSRDSSLSFCVVLSPETFSTFCGFGTHLWEDRACVKWDWMLLQLEIYWCLIWLVMNLWIIVVEAVTFFWWLKATSASIDHFSMMKF